MKRIAYILLAGFIAFNLTGCLTTSSIFDFDDDELNAYYENEIRKGTEEKLAAKEAEKNSASTSSSTTKTTTTTAAKKTETTDEKVARAKTLAKSSKLEDLETSSALITEARNVEPWNMDLVDLDYEIEEKLYAAKVKEAERLYNAGSKDALDKAAKLVNEVLDKRPGNTDARNLKSKIAVKKSNIIEEEDIPLRKERALQEKLESARARIKNGYPDDAIKMTQEILASNPNNSEAKTILADARTEYARKLAMNKGHLDEAEKFLNEALKDYPSHSGAKTLLAEVKDLKKKAEASPFKVGSVYTLSSFTENGKNLPKTQWKPGHKLTFTSKSTVEENSQVFSSYGEYGFHVDTASRSIIFNNTDPHNVMYTKATYSADLKTIILCGIDIKGNLDGTVLVFTLSK